MPEPTFVMDTDTRLYSGVIVPAINEALGEEVCHGIKSDSRTWTVMFHRKLTKPEQAQVRELMEAHNPDDDDSVRTSVKWLRARLADLEGESVRTLTPDQVEVLLQAVLWRLGIVDHDLAIKPLESWLKMP